MPKIKDLSSKFNLPTAEKELEMAMQESIMGQRSGGLSLFSDSFKRGYGNAVFGSDSNGIWLGAADYANAPFKVSMAGALTSTTATITGMGQNFVSTLAWTATDEDTATWASGTIKTSGGTSYAIDAGNTGNIAATTYVYLDPATSITVLQATTTATTAAGNGKILIAVVQIGAVGSECIIDVVGGSGTTIDGGRITTDTVTATQISVTNLAAINADLGTITAGTISIGTGNTILKINATGDMWSGNATEGSAPFQVTNAGVMTLTGASSSIAIGTANAIFKADSNGIYLGNATFASAPFRVSMAGALTATSATITGTITSSTISASTIKTVGSGQRAEFVADIVSGYDGLKWINTAGSEVAYLYCDNDGNFNLEGANTTLHADLIINSAFKTEGANNLVITPGGHMHIASGKNLVFLGTQGSINCGNIDCNAITMNDTALTNVTSISCRSIALSNDQNEGSITNLDRLQGYNDLRLQVASGGTGSGNRVMFVDSNNNEKASIRANDTGKFFSDNSYINLNGTDKLAIVPTKDGHKALYCAEAPEVWFFDFCKSKEDVDPLFLEVTEGEKKFIKVEGGGYQVWRRRKGHGNKRFESKTAEQFEANERFLSTPKEND